MADGKPRGDMRSLLRGVFSERAKAPLLTLNLLRQHWPDVVGPELSARTWPQRMERATLWIGAADASWVYELQFFKGELLASVQAFLENRSVTDVLFRVGAPPADTPAQGFVTPADPAGAAAEGPDTSAQAGPAGPASPFAEGATPPAARSAARIRDQLAARRTQAKAPQPSHAPIAPTPPKPLDPADASADRISEAAQAIADPGLRAVFQRSLAKQREARDHRAPNASDGPRPKRPDRLHGGHDEPEPSEEP